jgi:putative transposase
MVARPEMYQWSSYRAKIEGKWGWLDSDACFKGLAVDPVDRAVAYAKFVNEPISANIDAVIGQAIQRSQLTGSYRFIDEIENRLGVRVEFRGGGRPRKFL